LRILLSHRKPEFLDKMNPKGTFRFQLTTKYDVRMGFLERALWKKNQIYVFLF
jgi:hypothetical protein